MRRIFVLIAAAACLSGPARAYDFEPVKELDVTQVDPALMNDVYGAWEIRDKSGKKRCRITLLKEFGIGGRQVELAPGCEAAFPVMGDIGAWRLLEGWGIDLVDAIRKVRVRFTTPDERYVAFGDKKDIAGIDDFAKVPDKAPAKPAPKKK